MGIVAVKKLRTGVSDSRKAPRFELRGIAGMGRIIL